MQNLVIDKVKTGTGLAGARIAVIFAPPNAPAGSLSSLTRFLNSFPDIRAVPGYHGVENNHVLRISGIKSDGEFLHLLQEQFPKWKCQNEPEACNASFAKNIKCEKIEDVDHFPHDTRLKRFVKENANTLAGLSYITGNMGLLMSALKNPNRIPGAARTDWFKVYSSLAYNISTLLVVAFASKVDNPRDVYSIMEETYPKLKEAPDEHKQQVKDISSQVYSLLQKHPWEISSLVSLTGCAAHMISASKRMSTKAGRYEGMAVLGTTTAMLINTFATQPGGRKLFDLSKIFQRGEKDDILATLDEMSKNELYPNQAISDIINVKDWVLKNNLKVTAAIQATGNAGYGLAALRSRNGDRGLMFASGAYLLGNTMQLHSSTSRGPGLDDLVTAAANIISSDPMIANKSEHELNKQIKRFAELLEDEREVSFDKKQIAMGIHQRLKRREVPKSEENKLLTGFLKEERHTLKKSPFVSPHYVDAMLASGVETASPTV